MINLFIVNTSIWLDYWNKGEDDELRTQFKAYEYDGETEVDCIMKFVYDMEEAYSELYLQSVRVHHIFAYQDSDPNTLRVITDMTPYEKYFKQISCYETEVE